MPIYEYRCPSCGNVSEIWEGVGTRSDFLECRHCGE
jgi:putative FmdB family regulatory protein